jgi:transposase
MKQPNFAAMNPIVAKAIEQMMAEQGEEFSLEKINLAELERRTGISRQKLRSMKANGFEDVPHAAKGRKSPATLLSGYTGILEALLKSGVSNSAVCFDRLKKSGYAGGLTTVKVYIASHQYLIPPQRHVVAPQGNRGRRYLTPPGEAFQMDWGFTKVQCFDGSEYNAACFAMVCHHCGQQFIEFFPNAKQENLFIGMIHAFRYMGIPKTVLTDNMKSVVIRRDQDGHSVWQKDYEQFMRTVGFQTKLCKPRHPFTKGKVERLVRFVKDNFLAGRVFWNVTDLNYDALEWCAEQNEAYHKSLGIPNDEHTKHCAEVVSKLDDSMELMLYLCPERRISFDGFVNYEGRRFGVPYSYAGKTARVLRDHDQLYIYIKSGIDDIKKKQEKQDEQHIEIVSRLCSVEASAKQAHKRIDSLEGREQRE